MRIAVLGPLEVVAEEEVPVVVPGAKERLLLAVLVAAAPDVVSADRLADALWDGLAPATARKSLQAHLVRLRSSLEPDRAKGSTGQYVVRRGPGYALAVPRSAVDALHFGDLAARGHAQFASGDAPAAARQFGDALRLWRGEPYADWPDAGFAEAERQRLTEVHRGAVTGLLEAELALGRHAVVLPELQRRVTEEPLREDWWRLLMLARSRSGRQADALAAGRHVRSLLADELGSSPGPGLRDMEQAILAQDPALEVPSEPSRPVLARARDVPRAGPAATGSCPYKGLAPYQVADAPLFYGRHRLVTGLVGRLVDRHLVVVSGSSGAGKSSVVRAGVIPALTGGAVPGSEAWRPVILTPGPRPIDVLAELTGDAPPEEPVVLVVDQFEEVWAPGIGPAERTAFLDAVLGLLDDGIVARCIVVIRGDHLGRLAEHALFAERAGAALVLVPPLTDPELREIVREPARSVGLGVEPALLDAVVADVLGQPGALPLLSTALVGTWERRRGEVLGLAGYLEAGGVAGALTRSAEAAYAVLDEEARRTARRLLVRLADVDDGGALVKRSVPLAELDLDEEGGDARRQVVESFVSRRLLSVDGERLEVAHEALLTAWPRLARWLEDDAAGRAVRRHLTPAAIEWDNGGRPDDELFRGARLAAALDWIAAGGDVDVTPAEKRFLDASRARAEAELRETREQVGRERRARRRTRRLAAGLAALLVATLVAALLALRFQRAAELRATEAERLSLTSDANRLATLADGPVELDVSLLLAAQALRFAETPETEDGLLGALVAHQRALRVVAVGRRVVDSTLGGGGTLFLDHGVSLSAWSSSTSAQSETAPHRVGTWGGWVAADAAPTEDLLVGAGVDIYGEAWVRLLGSDGNGRPLVATGSLHGRPLDVSFTGDGRRVLLLETTDDPVSEDEPSWWVTDIDVATGHRVTGVAGTLPGAVDPQVADIADNGRYAVVSDRSSASATLVDLSGGTRVDLHLPPPGEIRSWFRALDSGAAQLWADGALTLYGADGRPTFQARPGFAPLLDVVVSPDGTWAATVDGQGTITLWDVHAAESRWTARDSFPGHLGEVQNAEITGDGRRLVTVGADERVVVWDAAPAGGFGTPVEVRGDREPAGRPQVVEPGRLVVLPTRSTGGAATDGPGSAVAGDLAATFLDPSSGRVLADVPVDDTEGHRSPEGPSLAVSPDRRKLAITNGLVTTVLDTATRRPIGEPITLPPGGQPGEDGRPLPAGAVSCLAWTPNSSHVLLCTRIDSPPRPAAEVVKVDPSSGERVGGNIFLAPFDAIALSPDRRFLAATNLQDYGLQVGRLVILDPETLGIRSAPVFGRKDVAIDMSFSPDGRRLAVTGASGELYLIDTETWRDSRARIASGAVLLQAEWLPDGRTVALAGADGTVSLFDAEREQLRAPAMSVPDAGNSPSLRLMVTASDELVAIGGDGPGRRWLLDPRSWADRACAVVGRDLTLREWERYIPDRPYEPTCSRSPD